MLNKTLNLTLKLNHSRSNLTPEGPFTPLEQTLKTPIDQPNQHGSFFPSKAIYSNPTYNESDDILTDIDEPGTGYKSTRNYTLSFTPNFDQLVLSVYFHLLSLPTTTPFLGAIPPSGLVSKVANETMNNIIQQHTQNHVNPPSYDHQSILNSEYLGNHSYQPIFLQLIRKRLIDLCAFNNSTQHGNVPSQHTKLPESTTVSITTSGNGASNPSFNTRQSSISNLSLTDLNISNYNNVPSSSSGSTSANRSRSSSMNLRKHSLTRNNSYSSNNWLHVGNINSIRPPVSANPGLGEHFNTSTESLHSIQDFVPQSFINRSAGNTTSYNSMMMDYQTPPNSQKGSIVASNTITPPQSAGTSIHQSLTNGHSMNTAESEELNFYHQQQQARSRSSSFPHPLTINTENANIQALNALNGTPSYNSNGARNNPNGMTLDSPFMSATTPSDDFGYFGNGFSVPQNQNGCNSNASSLSESPINLANESTLADSSKVNLPSQFSLSEKKRDSLKMKRGIH